MSNEEIVGLLGQYKSSSSTLGNAFINNKQWQRKANGLSNIVNDLMSEHSSQQSQQSYTRKPDIIDVRVKKNLLHAELDDMDSRESSPRLEPRQSASGSSKSSVKKQNKIIKFSKRANQKVIPSKRPQSSSEEDSSNSNSDSILLPDLNTNYQPEDNDSSEYDQGEEHQDDEESMEDDSSSILSKSQKSIRRTPG